MARPSTLGTTTSQKRCWHPRVPRAPPAGRIVPPLPPPLLWVLLFPRPGERGGVAGLAPRGGALGVCVCFWGGGGDGQSPGKPGEGSGAVETQRWQEERPRPPGGEVALMLGLGAGCSPWRRGCWQEELAGGPDPPFFF